MIDVALPSPHDYGICVLASVVAALIRGFTGFGFALAAVPLLSLRFAPSLVVPLVLWMTVLGSLFDIRSALKRCHWPSMRWLQIGAILGMPAGTLALAIIPPNAARIAIGCMTCVAVALLARGISFPTLPGNRAAIIAGALSGLFGGMAGMSGPPAVVFYTALPLSRQQVYASLLLFFAVLAAFGLINLAVLHLVTAQSLLLAVLSLPFVYSVQYLGLRLSAYGSDRFHKHVAIVALTAIAVSSIVKGVLDII